MNSASPGPGNQHRLLVLSSPDDVEEFSSVITAPSVTYSTSWLLLATLSSTHDERRHGNDRECYVTELRTRRLERIYNRRRPDPTSKSL